jgi:hypothetical protein
MQLAKNLLETVMLGLIALAAIALLHYYGEFSIPGSLLLGVGLTIVGLWLFRLWKLAAFQPYSVTIFVDFDALCNDIGFPRAPVDVDDIVYEIYNFTALNAVVFAHYAALSAKTNEHLNAANARSEIDYRTSMIFGNQIPCVFTPEQFDNSENRDPHPCFFFRPGRAGYTFGIRVVEKWWVEHRTKLSAEMRNAPIDFNEEIILSVLPYGYIPDHVRRWPSSNPFSLFDLRQRRWNSRLNTLGWHVSEFDPGRVEHRYLSISYDLLFG